MLVNFILYSFLVFQSSDQTQVKVAWEDGTPRLEYEIQQESGKDPVRHGDFKRWFQNGELAEKGKYRNGVKSGTWFTYYESGDVKSSGKYNKDNQKGAWKFYYPSKQLKAEGEFVDGHRHGRWQEWLEDGTENPLLSGDYQFHRASYPSGKARAAGTLLDSIQQGKWGYWWEDGSRQIECEYLRGRMH
ncbi:MAG: toxin-antitoxin system YwqK family antitoxin [Planctomycetes bacterium]|nr:toxin-antitoxin system YwqK family antitoxin [Planctomycetota bacterium]